MGSAHETKRENNSYFTTKFADQLTSLNRATLQEDWSYDKAGNAVLTQVNYQNQKGSFNNLNQLTGLGTGRRSAWVDDRLKVRGITSEPSNVYVNHQVATMTDATHFEHEIPVVQGSNTFKVEAQDGSGNRKTQNYQVSVTSPPAKVFNYDLNGNMLSDGTRTYAWDAANRLVKIIQSADTFEFSYNGLSQRVQEKINGSVIKNWVWAGGNQPAQERDASNVVTRSYYAEGEMQGATKLFYTKDHLQSVREVTDDAGIVRARYAYDGWGKRTKLFGDLDTVVSFTGHHWHTATESLLMLHRIYRPDIKMFISMDPIGEVGGVNLYHYTFNNPVNMWDPWGLDPTVYNQRDALKGLGHTDVMVPTKAGMQGGTAEWGKLRAYQDGPATIGGSSAYDAISLPTINLKDGRTSDQAIKDYLDTNTTNLFFPYCSSRVAEILREGGYRIDSGATPDALMNSVRKEKERIIKEQTGWNQSELILNMLGAA